MLQQHNVSRNLVLFGHVYSLNRQINVSRKYHIITYLNLGNNRLYYKIARRFREQKWRPLQSVGRELHNISVK